MKDPDLRGPDTVLAPPLGDFSAVKCTSASPARDGGSHQELFAIATRGTPSGLGQGGRWG
jgi:hypothetical protein